MKRSIFAICLLLIQCASPVKSPRIEVDVSACRQVLELFRTMHGEVDRATIEKQLDELLETKTYRTMLTHYNRSWRPNHLPPDVFKRLILSLKYPDAYEVGENQRADQMLPMWKKYYGDQNLFREQVEEIEAHDLRHLIDSAISEAHSWLPEEMRIQDFCFFIHPNGGSGAFTIGDAQGYDFFRLARDESGNLETGVLAEIAAHECHHLALNIPYPSLSTQTDSVAFEFLRMFVGEGTATKFINNAGGGAVPRIDTARTNTMMDPSSFELTKPLWAQYTQNEAQIFRRLESTFLSIVQGTMDRAAYEKAMREYWITGMIGRNYFVGAELFGAIYLGSNIKVCFDVIRDPRKMFDLYNRSIDAKPELLKNCPRIPPEIVQMALDIR